MPRGQRKLQDRPRRLGTWPLFTLARVLLPSDQRPLPSCPLFLEPQGSFPLAPPRRAPRINLCHSPSGSKAEISVLPAAACSASSPPDQILTLPLCGQKAQAKVCPDRKAAFFPSLPPKLTSGGSHLYLCRTACGTRLVPRRHHQQTLLPSLASLQRSHRLCQNASSCGLPADPWEQVGPGHLHGPAAHAEPARRGGSFGLLARHHLRQVAKAWGRLYH